MVTRLVCCFVLGIAVLGSSCKTASDATERVRTSPVATTAADSGRADAAASAALLTVHDLAGGWVEDSEQETDELELSEECDVFRDSDADETDRYPGELAYRESPVFVGEDDQQIVSFAAVFDSTAAAVMVFSDTKAAFARCGEALADATRQAIIDEVGDRVRPEELNIATNFTELPSPSLGEESLAYRLHAALVVRSISLDYFIDIIIARAGRISGGLYYVTLQKDDPQRDVSGRRAGDKLTAADRSLGAD